MAIGYSWRSTPKQTTPATARLGDVAKKAGPGANKPGLKISAKRARVRPDAVARRRSMVDRQARGR